MLILIDTFFKVGLVISVCCLLTYWLRVQHTRWLIKIMKQFEKEHPGTCGWCSFQRFKHSQGIKTDPCIKHVCPEGNCKCE